MGLYAGDVLTGLYSTPINALDCFNLEEEWKEEKSTSTRNTVSFAKHKIMSFFVSAKVVLHH